MSRRAGGWDQNQWCGNGSNPAASAGAWDRLPPILKAAMVWAFLRGGPSTPGDLVRLNEGLAYGERGPISLAVREEPRWMAEHLHRVLTTLSWVQVEAAVSIFLAPMDSRSVKNRRLRVNEKGDEADTWQVARKGEDLLRPAEAADYQRWIPSPLPAQREFLLWLHMVKDSHERWSAQQTKDFGFPPMPNPNGTDVPGRIFPIDLGGWLLQKQVFDHLHGIQWGYGLWRAMGITPSCPEQVGLSDIQAASHPGGGLVVARPGGQDAFIGGPKHGLKDFNQMILQALDSLDDFDHDMHIEALIHGREREAFAGVSQRRHAKRRRGVMRRVQHPV